VFAFQIFGGINVLVFSLLVLFTGAFLAGGYGNVLFLGITLCDAESGEC